MSGHSLRSVPVSTYRLQFNRDFTFDQASDVLPYLARLGITHVYSSPFLAARAGSSHGYDVVDYGKINPELGDAASFERFCRTLVAERLGLILDFVPNHMGIGKADNAWWLDVLEWGEASPYAGYFDIDWSPPKRDLEHKVLLPILGSTYGDTLVSGEIALKFERSGGHIDFWYHDHRLPLRPLDYPAVLAELAANPVFADLLDRWRAAAPSLGAPGGRDLAAALKQSLADEARDPDATYLIDAALAQCQGRAGDLRSFAPLHELLERQAYRLAYWKTASDEINYRRFFDIDDLAGIRMDQPAVFRDAHEFVGRLLAADRLQGLRIDHVDGLADPQRYLRRLHAFAAACMPRSDDGRRARPYILVEKILARDESLPRSWPVAGTTGYDYLALANGLFIDAAGYAKLQRFFNRFASLHLDLTQEIYACRRLVVERSFASELTYLANALVDIAEADWFTRDFTRKRLRDALTEIVSGFAVYRTYVTERGTSQADRAAIDAAIEVATGHWVGTDTEILKFLHGLLTLDVAKANPDHYDTKKDAILRFVARFQQYTGAIAAKAIEDTLFYRFVPLVSAHEVGASPLHPTTTIDEYHADAAARLAAHPLGMLASATHDTKRGEDTRARLDALSEMPDEWARRVARWHVYNRARLGEAGGSPAPSLRDEYLLYQSIVGTWPMQAAGLLRSAEARRVYVERLKAYAVKSSREAKLETSWVAPNAAYENGYCRFIDAIFENPGDNRFIDSVLRFLPRLRRLGAFNGLTQLVLKATAPGVPDFYQGSEFWDLSLVDPDNRRPVDYRARIAALAAPDFATALMRWREGWLKQWVTHRLLDLRNRTPDLFRNGTYEAVTIAGPAEKSILAFQRRNGAAAILVIACRLVGDKAPGDLGPFWPGAQFLGQTRLEGVAPGRWIDRLTDRVIDAGESGVALSEALSHLPVAVLGAETNAEGR